MNEESDFQSGWQMKILSISFTPDTMKTKPKKNKKKIICKFKENGDNSIRFFQAAEYVISRSRKLSSKWELKKADKQLGLLKHTQKIHKLLSPSALKRGDVRDENWKTDRNSI